MAEEDEIRGAIRDVESSGRVACRDLLAIAERLGVEPERVGRACNEMKIRICECQLGCFR